MTNYAAAPIQPIINGILSIVGGAPVFTGRGVGMIMRTAGGATFGDFTIILDQGLPGDVAIDPDYARTMITQRGTLGAVPGGTTINQQAVTYPGTATIRIVMSVSGTGTDPASAEIAVWRTN
jgi:hypothetical protein